MNTLLKTTALAISLGAAMTALPGIASAQVLTVDLDQIQQSSAAAKSAQTQIQSTYGARINAARTAFQSAVTNYNTVVTAAKKVQKPDGSLPPANQTQVEQARNTLANANKTAEDLQNQLQAIGQYVNYQIVQKAEPIAEQIRQQRKASVVMPQGSTLAADPQSNVTTAVMQQLDRTFPTASITLPQQGQAPAPAAQQPAPAARPTQGR